MSSVAVRAVHEREECGGSKGEKRGKVYPRRKRRYKKSSRGKRDEIDKEVCYAI